jgi:hypothetical protein
LLHTFSLGAGIRDPNTGAAGRVPEASRFQNCHDVVASCGSICLVDVCLTYQNVYSSVPKRMSL